MHTQADKAPDNNSQAAVAGRAQAEGGAGLSVQLMGNSAEAATQQEARQMANNSRQTAQLRGYQEMANNSPQVKQAAQLQAMANRRSGPSSTAVVVQRIVLDGEQKPVDIDTFFTTYMVPQYAAIGVTPEEETALTELLKGKAAIFFVPEDDDPTSLEDLRKAVADGGMGTLSIRSALAEIRSKAEEERLAALPPAISEAEAAPAEATASEAVAEVVTEPVVAEPEQAGGSESSGAAREEAPVPTAVVEPAAEEEAGDPNSLATAKFRSLGGGKYGSTSEVTAQDVDRLVAKSRRERVKLTVLTGTHGDEKGWLIGEKSFASSDARALTAAGINVIDVNGQSKSAIKALIDSAATPAVLLAWCFSKVSYDNWGNIHAIFTRKDDYMELNDELTELIDEADDVCESAVPKDVERYAELKIAIPAKRAEMMALLDW